jgi:thiamine biosynthesis lipoprotein ApbE
MAKSTLAITISAGNKGMSVVGLAAIRETVSVTVVGGASLIADGLKVLLQSLQSTGGVAKIASVETWQTSGLDAVGDMDMNTDEAIAAFSLAPNLGMRPFNILVYTSTGTALKVNSVVNVMNFPVSASGEPTVRASFP